MTRLLAVALLATAFPAFAQQPAPPAPPAGPDHNRRMEVRMPNFDHPAGAMDIVPPGTWWRSAGTIKELGLSDDQQKKMDEIFRQNRIQLIDMKASLEKEQLNLEPILNGNPPDTGKAFNEISKIADLRADLEKANAKMLLGLRSQLTADQWTKLQSVHPFTINMPDMRNMRDFHFKTGEGRTDTTITCSQKTGSSSKQCTTTTITVKDDGGKPAITTCVTSPGQTTPKCTTTPTGISDGSFNLTIPRDSLPTPPPASFSLPIPSGDSE